MWRCAHDSNAGYPLPELDEQIRVDINHIAAIVLASEDKQMTGNKLARTPYFSQYPVEEARKRIDTAGYYGRFLCVLGGHASKNTRGLYSVMPSGDISGLKFQIPCPELGRRGLTNKHSVVPLVSEVPAKYKGHKTLPEMIKEHRTTRVGLAVLINAGKVPFPSVRVGGALLWESTKPSNHKAEATCNDPVANVTIKRVNPEGKAWIAAELRGLYNSCDAGLSSVQKDKLSILNTMALVV